MSGIPLWLLRDGNFEGWYSAKWTGGMTPYIARSVPEDELREARITRMEEALYHAHEFISSVTAWTGHEDGDREALAEIDDALTKGDGTSEDDREEMLDIIRRALTAALEGSPDV